METFKNVIDILLTERNRFNRIWYGGDNCEPPPFSYQVNFPRLELVLSGTYVNEVEDQDGEIATVKADSSTQIFLVE